MKNFFLLVVILQLAYTGYSHQYVPFPTRDAYWYNDVEYNEQQIDHFYAMYFLDGSDTILNGNNYYLIKYRISYIALDAVIDHNLIANGRDIVAGYIREENKKIYIWYPSSAGEVLYYDFNLKVGDPVIKKKNVSVSSIDTIFINNVEHLKFNCSNNYYLIDGIGSSDGFLNPGALGSQDFFIPVCFHDAAGVFTYEHEGSPCPTIFPEGTPAIVNNISAPTLKIYPNPFTDKLTIESPGTCNVTLYNSIGTIVFNKTITQTGVNTISDIAYNPPGIYYLIIKDEQNNILKKEKLVKL